LAWTVSYTDTALKSLKKLDRPDARNVIEFMEKRVAASDNPRALGKRLTGPTLGTYIRYRIGNIRVICDLKNGELQILVVRIGYRRKIYL